MKSPDGWRCATDLRSLMGPIKYGSNTYARSTKNTIYNTIYRTVINPPCIIFCIKQRFKRVLKKATVLHAFKNMLIYFYHIFVLNLFRLIIICPHTIYEIIIWSVRYWCWSSLWSMGLIFAVLVLCHYILYSIIIL